MRLQYSIVFFLALLTLPLLAQQKEIPPVPNPPRLVNDFADILNPAQEAALERKLVAYDDTTSTQIAVVIESSIGGEDIFDYSFRLAESWGIGGSEENDNGVLIYIAFEDRNLFIQTGYGAEGFLPDAYAKRIIDNVITPAFRNQQYYEGLNEATDIIMGLGSGEYTAEELEEEGGGNPIPGIVILILIVILVVALMSSGGGDDDGGFHRGGRYNRGGGGWVFFPMGGGGGWSGGGGGSGGFGGGGGFGGFGGGSFGGGGAGGSW